MFVSAITLTDLINNYIEAHQICSDTFTTYSKVILDVPGGIIATDTFSSGLEQTLEDFVTLTDILQKLNEDLTDIIVYGTACVDAEFYPRYAKQRSYRYYLKKNNSLDVEKVFPAASYFT